DNKNSEVKTTEFNFTPKVGYFFTDKIAGSINIHAGVNVEEAYGDDKKEKANSLGVGLFGRYYFLEFGSRFKTYAEVNADYQNATSEYTSAGTTTENPAVNTFGIAGGIGANYFLTDKIAVNFALSNIIGFNTSKVDADGAEAINSFGLNVNQYNNFFEAATFGLTFKF